MSAGFDAKRNKLKNLFFREQKNQVRFDIQAMRALAVIAVVVYHVHPTYLKGGFAGVDIFFVISGFLMTAHIVSGLENGGLEKGKKFDFFSNFYARRIRRLAPAALSTIFFVIIFVEFAFKLDLNSQFLTLKQAIPSALFFQNWKLAGDAVDYLSQNNAPTAFQHFWSLSVEEQFYLIWPLLLMIVMIMAFYFSSRFSKSKTSFSHIVPLRIFICTFTLLSFIYGVYLTSSNQAAAYFVTPARIWELSLGGVVAVSSPLICILEKSLKSSGTRFWIAKLIWELIPFFGVALCFYTVIFIDSNQHAWPGKFAIIPTIGTAIVLWSGMNSKNHKRTKIN